MEELKNIYLILGIAIIVIQFLAQWFWTRFELRQLRKDSEQNDDTIKQLILSSISNVEEKRLNNVKALREIYDGKVDDARKHARGLFELRENEISELSKRISSLETKFDVQSANLNQKFESLIKSNALIEAHIRTCPFYGKEKKEG